MKQQLARFLGGWKRSSAVTPRRDATRADYAVLEDRVLFSAVTAESAAALLDQAELHLGESKVELDFELYDSSVGEPAAEMYVADTVASTDMDQPSQLDRVLLVVDERVDDLQVLLDGLDESIDKIEILRIGTDDDGVTRISEVLEELGRVQAIHVLSHGSNGGIQLGSTWLDAESAETHAAQIAGWSRYLATDADIMVYGCQLASSPQGLELIDDLVALTGADVAASDDLTGHVGLGGDWEFEYVVGEVETEVLFSRDAQAAWEHVLATVTVTNATDASNGTTTSIADLILNDGGDGISLREAIEATNNTANSGGPDEILFALTGGTGFYEIQPNATIGLPQITDAVVINATSQSGYDGIVPRIVLNGAGSIADGFSIASTGSGSSISGFSIVGFANGIGMYSSDGNVIDENYIGYDPSVSVAATGATVHGILLQNSDSNSIGGNTIVNHGTSGIALTLGSSNNVLTGNYIGADSAGTDHGNAGPGILVKTTSAGNEIGRIGEGNVIAYNGNDGIYVESTAGSGTLIRGNSIHSNAGLGIDLQGGSEDGFGVTSQFAPDADPSNIENWPQITAATSNGTMTELSVTVLPRTIGVFEIDFFSNTSADASGHGEGQTYLGSYTTGVISASTAFDIVLADGTYGEFLSATLTNLTTGNTSEFGNVQSVLADNRASADLDLDNDSGATGSDFITTFTPGVGPINIADSDAVVVDLDNSPTIVGMDVKITNLLNGINESLFVDTSSYAGITATYNSGLGTLAISGAGSRADYEAILRAVTYENTASATNATTRMISVEVTDGSGFGTIAYAQVAYNVNRSAFWLTTSADVSSPSNAPGLDSWSAQEIVQFGDPNFTLEPLSGNTDGTFSSVVDFDLFSDATGNIDGMHLVGTDITFNGVAVNVGDVLFSTTNGGIYTSANSLSVHQDNIYVFRPGVAGDYSSGTFDIVVDSATSPISTVGAFSLIESSVSVGGVTFDAGDLLYSDGSQDLLLFDQSASTSSRIIDSSEIGMNGANSFTGIEVVESTTKIGEVSFSSGQLIASVSSNDTIAGLSVRSEDLFVLDVTATGASTAATAVLVMEGADFGFSALHNWNGLTLVTTDVADLPPTDLSPGIQLNTDGGNNAYLLGTPISTSLDQITFESQFTLTNESAQSPLVSYNNGASYDFLVHIHVGGIIELGVANLSVYTSGIDFDAMLRDGEMHSVAVTWENVSGNWSIYVDGAVITSGSGLAIGQSINAGGTLVLGQEQDAGNSGYNPAQVFHGTLHDVRLWDVVRSSQQIAEHDQQQFEPSSLPNNLIANWQMNDLTGVGSDTVVDVVSPGMNDLMVNYVSTGGGFVASSPIDRLNVDENATNGISVGHVVPTDADPNAGGFTYSLTNDAGGRFAIDALSGEITVVDGSLLNFESAASHDITIQVRDVASNGYAETLTVYINNVNEAPSFSGFSPAPTYNENDSGVLIWSATIANDVDSSNLAGGQLAARFTGGIDSADWLRVLPGGNVLIVGMDVVVSGTTIGTYTGGHGADLIINLNANANTTNITEVIQRIAYANTSDMISGTRVVELELTDGDGGTSAPLSQTVNLNEINDVPIARDDRSGLAFDGIDDVVTVADNATLQMMNTMTMEAWFRADALSTQSMLIINKEGEYEVGLSTAGEIMWAFDNTAPDWSWHNTGYLVSVGQWTHVAVSYDSGTVNTYVNGNLVDAYFGSGSINDNYPLLNELRIGGRSNSPTNQFFNGQIDEVRIWDTARSQFDIQATLDVQLTGTEMELAGYWTFDEGSGATADDRSLNSNIGMLVDGGAGSFGPQWASYSVAADATLSVADANGVLTNDIDVDGDAFTVVSVDTTSTLGMVVINAAGGISYDPTGAFDSLDSGEVAFDTVSYTIEDTNGNQDTATVSIRVVGVNDAPTLNDGVLADNTEGNPNPAGDTISNIFAGQFADPDSGGSFAGIVIVADATSSEGTWLYSTDSGSSWLSVGAVSTSSGLTLNSSAMLWFAPGVNFTGPVPLLSSHGLDNTFAGSFTNGATREFTDVSIRGGTSAISDVSADIVTNVTAVNDAPVVSNLESSTLNFIENSGPNAITSALTLSDVDNAQLASAIITISSGFVSGQDALSFFNTANISGTWDGVAGTLTLVGADSISNYESALRSVTFQNNSDDPSTGLRTIEITVSDGMAQSNIGARNVSVIATNDSAVVDLDGSDSLGNDFSATFTEGDPPVKIADIDAILIDPDNVAYLSLNIDLSGGFTSSDEKISVAGQTFSYGIPASPFVSSVGSTNFMISFDGTTFVVQRDGGGAIPQNDLESFIRDIAYENTSENPSAGLRTLSFSPTDGDGLAGAFSSATVNVSPVNDVPVIVSPGFGSPENQAVVGTLVATDVDDPVNSLTWSISGNGMDDAFFTIDGSTGELSFISLPDFESPVDANGDNDYDIEIRVSDGGAMTVKAITVTVSDQNESPSVTLSNVVTNLPEDTDTSSSTKIADIVVTDDALGTNALSLSGADAASFEIIGVELHLRAGATLDFESKSALDVTVNVNDLAIGAGIDDFATHSLAITDVNDAPIANDDHFVMNENSVLNKNVISNAVGADTDPDGDTLTVVTIPIVPPTHGTLVLSSDGSFVYTPDRGYSGTDTFEYRIDDGNGGQSAASVTININSNNRPPIANDDSFSLAGNELFVIEALSVLANDIDADGDSMTIVLLSQPGNGHVTVAPNGSFIYVPNSSFVGIDSFTYAVSDAESQSAPAVISVEIIGGVITPPSGGATDPADPTNVPDEEDQTEKDVVDISKGQIPADAIQRELNGSAAAIRIRDERSAASQGLAASSDTTMSEIAVALADIEPGLAEAISVAQVQRVGTVGSRDISSMISGSSFEAITIDTRAMFDAFDRAINDIEMNNHTLHLVAQAAKVVSSGLSVGYLLWTVRGSYLVAILSSSLPVWSQFDPVPVLAGWNAAPIIDDEEDILSSIATPIT